MTGPPPAAAAPALLRWDLFADPDGQDYLGSLFAAATRAEALLLGARIFGGPVIASRHLVDQGGGGGGGRAAAASAALLDPRDRVRSPPAAAPPPSGLSGR